MTGTARVVRGNALALPLPDDSVDLVVTSPPYFGLRSYQDGGQHYDGQIGDEATPGEFVDALIAATAEMVRVLKPTGSIWVNLGDKYAGSTRFMPAHRGQLSDTPAHNAAQRQTRESAATLSDVQTPGILPKSLIGVPWRYALRCIDDLGLILRAEVIWSKPNGLPESVTDRVRRSHETWFHFTLRPRYFSAVDEVREATNIGLRPVMTWDERKAAGNVTHSPDNGHSTGVGMAPNPLGKLPGSVWTIPTEPLRVPDHVGVDHFAAFPTEWPRRIILGWSPSGVCVDCGEGRRPVADRTQHARNPAAVEHIGHQDPRAKEQGRQTRASIVSTRVIVGEECDCPEPTADTTPAVVLDPFGGTGTTALVAKALGRDGISVDMSADYCRLAEWRVNDPDQIAKAMRVDKPPKELDGQDDLLALLDEEAS